MGLSVCDFLEGYVQPPAHIWGYDLASTGYPLPNRVPLRVTNATLDWDGASVGGA